MVVTLGGGRVIEIEVLLQVCDKDLPLCAVSRGDALLQLRQIIGDEEDAGMCRVDIHCSIGRNAASAAAQHE